MLGVAVLGTAVLQHQCEITLNTALVHAASSHRTNPFMESHTTSRWSTDMEYLGVAVLGVGVLGAAVLGTAVLHPQTRSLSTQHSFTLLLPQSISNHGVA